MPYDCEPAGERLKLIRLLVILKNTTITRKFLFSVSLCRVFSIVYTLYIDIEIAVQFFGCTNLKTD